MCGIYGYIGKQNAYKKVFEGLKLLQYRGYDSCGIAYYDKQFKVEKAIGTLVNLPKIDTETKIAFGHTRWATNGEVNLQNTHPHKSSDDRYIIVHNGIISNAELIKKDLLENNVKFYSQTDTEVIINMLSNMRGEFEENLMKIFDILEGSFSLIIGDSKTGDLYLVKKFSPLNVLIADDGIYISSDVNSLKDGRLYSMVDGDILKITNGRITSLTNNEVKYSTHSNNIKALDLGEYPHFMLKEINEIPNAVYNTYKYLSKVDINKIFKGITQITMLGCGTAYHSCLVGEYLFNKHTKIKAQTFLASSYDVPTKIKNNHLHIIVSQSGETADCIKIAGQIKAHKGKILIITNEAKSTITKFANCLLVTQAEKELAVASTKTYCAQLFVFAYICHIITDKKYQLDAVQLRDRLTKCIKDINITSFANQIKDVNGLIMIGCGMDYNTILEASLKIREIDYIFTVPIISSELKHGTLSLIDNNCFVISLNTDIENKKQELAINEVKSRGGKVLDFSKVLNLTNIDEWYKPIFAIVPFQLLCYNVAINKGLNPDMPRNLAKSVTVE